MKCPKCGYERQPRDNVFVSPTECPACSVVYAKHDPDFIDKINEGHVSMSQLMKPSPVHESSLRQARERVEKKLRQQLGSRLGDDRHAKTLERARKLAVEGVKKRQAEWKRHHPEDDPEAPAMDADSSMDESAALVPSDEAQGGPEAFAKDDEHAVSDLEADEGHADEALLHTIDAESKSSEAVDIDGSTAASRHDSTDEPRTAESEVAMDALPSKSKENLSMPPATETEPPKPKSDPSMDLSATKALEDEGDPNIVLSASATTDEAPAHDTTEDEDLAPHIIQSSTSIRHRRVKGSQGRGLIRLLPVVAWMILCAGIVGAILSWVTMGDVEAAARPPMPQGLAVLPLGLLLGFAYLATGVLGFAFFWVASLISGQLREIRRLLITPLLSPEDNVPPESEQMSN